MNWPTDPRLKTSRRHFLHASALGGAALLGLPMGCSTSASRSPGKQRPVAFNTANLVARVTNYRFELSHWGDQHQKTVAMTDAGAWRAICAEIARAGFHAVEVWEAHASPEALDQQQALLWKRILDDHGLKPIGYGGSLRPETARLCQWMGIPSINGGLRGQTPAQATELCRQHAVHFNIENHPEKTVDEVLKPIAGGNDWLGVCVDTGWFGTQGVSAATMIHSFDKRVRHTHIKDVKAAGGHATCLLGDGVVGLAAVMAALREIGYAGWYSWEDEPEDRNPFDSAVRNRQWIEAHL
jgi:L-ribulose-5-phosphate 3-epimerase